MKKKLFLTAQLSTVVLTCYVQKFLVVVNAQKVRTGNENKIFGGRKKYLVGSICVHVRQDVETPFNMAFAGLLSRLHAVLNKIWAV